MRVVRFDPEHALRLRLQPAQEHERALFTPEHLSALARTQAFTAIAGNRPMMCFGWYPVYAQRAVLWALLDKAAGRHMVALTRIGKRLVNELPHRRIEAEVAAEFDAGRRWVELMGLTQETPTPLKAYNVHGGDVYIYSKVKQWPS